ncbi:glycosyltransferase [Pontixanthobacter gangjinensis]|uniref:Glycosyltransferase n=1 Tax=Christiangramia aestuarii TaxID=1028746 RepID=A0A7K1LLW9_9FLAO|nr:glycosyltransferase [Christiangramia aestuarii]MUP41787.1 glycosyltransferase [Christiangramia aestuarii]
MNPLVSVIIPCYNEKDFISSAVRSAYSQTYNNKEIIVVDDGSDAGTKNVLNNLKDSIDHLITQKNSGVVSARNNGIKRAKGQYILTLDSDDWFEEEFLEKAVQILKNNPKVGMVSCWTAVRNSEDKITRISKPTGGSAFNALFRNNAPASLLFRKSCWEDVGGYDENLNKGYEDWEFNVAVGKFGWQVYIIPEILFNYRNVALSRNKFARDFYDEIRLYTFKKHKDLIIENFDPTIELLLGEIEKLKKENKKIKNSAGKRLGDLILRPLKKIRSKFS